MIPLQLPTPPELLVILLIFLILGGIPLGIVYLLRRRKNRIEDLESQVEKLQTRQE